MQPKGFSKFVRNHGKSESYEAGQIFHAQKFPEKLFFVERGYVKRYQATKLEKKVIELIYGPGDIIALSQLYKKLFGINQNQHGYIYVYQAMTDVKLTSVDVDTVVKELEKDPALYKDFFYESGIKVRSNISRLASNALQDDYQKVAHQLVSLAYEFAHIGESEIRKNIKLPLPQSSTDIAEQLNISKEVTEAVLDRFTKNKIIKINGNTITILRIELLKDIYF